MTKSLIQALANDPDCRAPLGAIALILSRNPDGNAAAQTAIMDIVAGVPALAAIITGVPPEDFALLLENINAALGGM